MHEMGTGVPQAFGGSSPGRHVVYTDRKTSSESQLEYQLDKTESLGWFRSGCVKPKVVLGR